MTQLSHISLVVRYYTHHILHGTRFGHDTAYAPTTDGGRRALRDEDKCFCSQANPCLDIGKARDNWLPDLLYTVWACAINVHYRSIHFADLKWPVDWRNQTISRTGKYQSTLRFIFQERLWRFVSNHCFEWTFPHSHAWFATNAREGPLRPSCSIYAAWFFNTQSIAWC
jgi:hypothetical protein